MAKKGVTALVKLDGHYVDPRLVELYDHDNPRGADTDFYLHLAATLDARQILDLGCGTGLLTRELAAVEGRVVTGVDPAPAMLAVARRQPDANRVIWVEGDASALVLTDGFSCAMQVSQIDPERPSQHLAVAMDPYSSRWVN